MKEMKEMKRLAIVLAVISLLALCQTSQAVDLQAGWYANISGVYVFTYGDYGLPYLRGPAPFLTEPGQYGPFTVTGGSPYYQGRRYVSVATPAYGVTPAQSLILPINLAVGDTVAYLDIACETDYDSSAMVLEFWREYTSGPKELLWAQHGSGLQYATFQTAYDADPNAASYYFKVSIVPEPASLLSLVCGIAGIGYCWRRRR